MKPKDFNIKSAKIIKWLITFSILTSFITYVVDSNSPNVFISRLTIPSIFGLVALCAFAILNSKNLLSNSKKLIIQFYAPLILLLGLSFSLFFSLNMSWTIKELLIITYLIFYAILLVLVFKNDLLKRLIPLIIITSLITSFIGLYDLVAKNLDWFSIFNVSDSYAKSGFRYFGQAGQYIQIMLMVLIPLKYSKLNNKLSKSNKNILSFVIAISIIFLLATGKISAIIGFLIGLFIFIGIYRKIIFKDVLVSLILFFLVFLIAKEIIPNTVERLTYRIESRITNRVEGTPEADFVISNFDNSIKAFIENPLTGTGLGAYQGVYADTEIHGTYLKMLGETGLIGLLGYLVFMGSIAYMLFKATKVKHNKYADFLVKLIPFFIGFLVCQAYCYHIRKLEFWILYAVIIIAYLNMNTTIKLPNLSEAKTN